MNATPNGVNDRPKNRPTTNVEPLAASEHDTFFENLDADDEWEFVIQHQLREQHRCVENFAADLTDVAYQVALRHGVGDQWLEFELDLWEKLTEAIQKHCWLLPMNRP